MGLPAPDILQTRVVGLTRKTCKSFPIPELLIARMIKYGPQHWLYEVRIPRHLLGEHISALRDSMQLLRKAEAILTVYADEEIQNARDEQEVNGSEQEMD